MKGDGGRRRTRRGDPPLQCVRGPWRHRCKGARPLRRVPFRRYPTIPDFSEALGLALRFSEKALDLAEFRATLHEVTQAGGGWSGHLDELGPSS